MVASVISAMVNKPQFIEAIKAKIGMSVDTKDMENQVVVLQGQLKQAAGIKSRLERQMDTLDIDDPHFDRKLADLQRRYDEQYDIIGNILGSIKISTLTFGTTACTLMVGLIVGYCIKKASKKSFISSQCLNAFRNFGLALFFVGTGFSTGTQDIVFDIRAILYGILITISAVVCGWVLCKFVEKKYSSHQGIIIAGGMTSSPAYGALSGFTTEASVNCFSFSYFGALVTLIIAIQIII